MGIGGGLVGSSPLARGTSFLNDRGTRPIRLIPARAGNILLIAASRTRSSAHPRSRGEHPNHERDKQLTLGSSPLARGTLSARKIRKTRNRLIPARAGNISCAGASGSAGAAHPRSRGEHHGVHIMHPVQGGSSPLARGTSVKRLLRYSYQRLIPARAGNIYLAKT